MLNDLKFCQFCGAPLEADMKVCAGCGQPVGGTGSPLEYLQGTPEPARPATPLEPQPARADENPFLTEEVKAAPPPPPPATTPPPPAAGKKKFPTWAIIVIVLVVVCCCLTFIIGGVALFQVINQSNVSTDDIVPSIFETLEVPLLTPELIQPQETESVNLPPPTPEPPLIPTSPPPPTVGQSLTEDTLIDDFSSNQFEWAEEADDISVHGFRDGRYFIQVLQPEYFAWSFIPTDFNPTTVRFNVQIAGSASEGTFGVMCNFQDSSNYHYVEIDLDTRAFQIGQEQNDQSYPLTSTDWVDAFYLQDDPYAVNQVSVYCTTDTIRLEINGNLEAEVSFIPAEPDGWVALYAASWDTLSPGGFTVYFDDLYATTRE